MPEIDERRAAIVARYAESKNRRDIDAALMLCSDRMILHSASLDMVSTFRGHKAIQAGMLRFYKLFSEYSGETHTRWQAEIALVSKGEVTLRVNPDLLADPSTSISVVAPFLAVFEFDGDMIAGERYYPGFEYAGILKRLKPAVRMAIAANRLTSGVFNRA